MKTKLFTMKMSEEEITKYKELAKSHDLSLAELIRSKLDGSKISKRRKIPTADPQLLRQIAAIGNNLNQIARRLNQGEKIDILPHLISIEQSLEDLIKC